MPRPRKSTYGNEKPPYSYVALCAMAIQNSSAGMLTLNEIYRFITNNFPFYKANSSKWRNSLRHNLSFNDCFVKIVCTTSNGSKKSYWSLHPRCGNMFKDGSFLRRKKRFVTGQQHEMSKEFSWGKSMGHEKQREFEAKACIVQSSECTEGLGNRPHDSKKKTDFTIDNILSSPAKNEQNVRPSNNKSVCPKDEDHRQLFRASNGFTCDSERLCAEFAQPQVCEHFKCIASSNWLYYNMNSTYNGCASASKTDLHPCLLPPEFHLRGSIFHNCSFHAH